MYRRRNLLGKFYRLLSNPAAYIAMLEQTLQNTRYKLSNKITECTALEDELKYLYQILQRRTGCTIDTQIDNNKGIILFTTTSDGIIKNTIVYAPQEQIQIAEINTTADGTIL